MSTSTTLLDQNLSSDLHSYKFNINLRGVSTGTQELHLYSTLTFGPGALYMETQ